jgi:hypothetical protein
MYACIVHTMSRNRNEPMFKGMWGFTKSSYFKITTTNNILVLELANVM